MPGNPLRHGNRLLQRVALAAIALAAAVVIAAEAASADVSPEQRKELASLKSDVNKVPAMLRRKEFDAADAALDAAETKLQEIATAAGVATDDRSLLGVAALIGRQREALARLQQKAGNAGGGISFSRDVAPIVADACLGCHGAENPRANLRLDTFVGWKRGGRSGPLLVVGNADNSLLLRALRATDAERRMPKGGDPLSEE
ncbi:MAG: hypothetical protein JNG89_13390, partial [Planctomycetaceae bacterium]|nr:hypothetical protein [Planctomycetaceae bacterium]